VGLFSSGGGYLSEGYNSYNLFKHPTSYAEVFIPPLPPGYGEAEWSETRIRHVYGFSSFGSIVELRGAGMVVTQPTDSTPFNLTGGSLTDFSFSAFGRISVLNVASNIFMSAALFWTLTKAEAWHDIYMVAAAGDDVMTGTERADFIEGWSGSDVITGAAGNDRIWGNTGSDFLYGGADSDILVGNDWAPGGFSTLWNQCWGGPGDDFLYTGGYGSGHLVGEAGVDRLWGAGQSDVLEGGTGADFMAGGGGLDVFRVKAEDMVAGDIDTILDFQDGLSFIQLVPHTSYWLVDSAYGAFLSVPGTGGSWGMIIPYNTAAQVSDQIFFAA
jgi:Ca2+-binding RTX toxin-like protein